MPAGWTPEQIKQFQDYWGHRGLNSPISVDEQQKIADALTFIVNEDTSALHPHPYENYPHTRTGAMLPPSAQGYTAYDVPGLGVGRGEGRLLIDNGTRGDLLHKHLLLQLLPRSVAPGWRVKAMRIIELDATKWKTVLDFYHALLASIGAPNWHSESPDALIDSMIWGGINAVEPPYVIRISGAATLPKDVHGHVELVKGALAKARADYRKLRGGDVEVVIKIDP